MYLDANDLYGWSISQYLPYGEFKWLNKKEIDNIDVNSIKCSFLKDNSSDGYILAVEEVEYPDDLLEFYSDYPLAPEKLEIGNDKLSSYCSNIANKYDIKIDGVNNLVQNLAVMFFIIKISSCAYRWE